MKRHGITATWATMLLLAGILLLGTTGCEDRLLPPDPGSATPGRESLVYLNAFGAEVTPDMIDASRTLIVAKRPDGTGTRTISAGLIGSSPQNGRIAYFYADSTGLKPSGIYLASDDGSGPTLFEPASADATTLNPWSITLGPDGASVAWVAADDIGNASLVIRTPQRRWQVPLGELSAYSYGLSVPRFSPDGSYVAYAVMSPDPYDPSGSIKLVQTSSGIVRDISARIMPTLSGMVSPPFDWAPDSRRILYAGTITDDAFNYSTEPMVVNIATGITDTLMHDGTVKESPRWLPGGNQICYVVMSDYGGADLYLRDATGQARRLTFDEATTTEPSYKFGLSISPDGSTALYTEFASFDQSFGTLRAFDLIRRTAGPVLSTNADLGHWRQ